MLCLGLDKAGRSLLHTAVLYQQPGVVDFLCEQHPNLINSRDSVSHWSPPPPHPKLHQLQRQRESRAHLSLGLVREIG